MTKEELERSNLKKYGPKEFDQITENYNISLERGDIWCAENIKRYLNRFTRKDSTKGSNLTDLYKALDYLNRMIIIHSNLELVVSEEIIE